MVGLLHTPGSSPHRSPKATNRLNKKVSDLPLPNSCLADVDFPPPRADKCVLTIDGQSFDVTDWVDRHPGGNVITQYDGKDATHVFHAFHSKEALKRLNKMTPLSKQAMKKRQDDRSSTLLKNFDKLRQELIDEGFFQTSKLWYFYKTVTTVGFCPLAILALSQGYWLLSALLMGVCWQQLGWLAHEYCHHQVFENRQVNHWFGLFLGNVAQGYSSSWWKDRHNSHHASTNLVDHDPDIDNIPLMAWAVSDLDKAPLWARSTIKYQAYYFLFVLPLLRLIWCMESIKFVMGMKESRFKYYNKIATAESIGLALHWAWSLTLLSFVPGFGAKAAYFCISQMLAGFGIGIVVFFNHYSCEKYDQALAGNFVCLQLYTTRNMTPGVITDWVCGGLNYQIEHHLFPTMPRHNLNASSKRIQQFCKDNKVPYQSCGFIEGVGYVLEFLSEIAAQADDRFAWLEAQKAK